MPTSKMEVRPCQGQLPEQVTKAAGKTIERVGGVERPREVGVDKPSSCVGCC